MNAAPSTSFFGRHEFLLRRWHSVTGLIPIGAYMVVHLLVNASLLTGPTTFQKNVYQIHGLEDFLIVVEWAFIFLPIFFHGILGVMIIRGGLPNTKLYPYVSNVRYTLQRATGLVAFVFIVLHVFHLHGWFHSDVWLENVARPLHGSQFRPFNAASTLGAALQSGVIQVLYAVGLLCCVYHFANGLWTMGITWGVWTAPAAQRRASWVCGLVGVALAGVGLTALVAAARVDLEQARQDEVRMYRARVTAGDIKPNPHKLAAEVDLEPGPAAPSSGTQLE